MITLLTYLKARKYHTLYEVDSNQWWTILSLDIAGVVIILVTISMIWVAVGGAI